MNNLRVLDLLTDATQSDDLLWYLNSDSKYQIIFLNFDALYSYYIKLEGYKIVVFLKEIRKSAPKDGEPKTIIAIGLEISSLDGSEVCSMTSDPDIINGDIPEPKEDYLAILYLSIRKSWFKWAKGREFNRVYPDENIIIPRGWPDSGFFSSKPIVYPRNEL